MLGLETHTVAANLHQESGAAKPYWQSEDLQ